MVFEPTRRYWRDDTRVTDSPVPVRVTAGQTATADLDPTGGTWCYAVTWTPDGDALPWTEYVLVPAGLEPVEYRELQRLTRDAAQLLTGEDAVTAATALSRITETAGDVDAAVGGAVQAAQAAAEDARSQVSAFIAAADAGEFKGDPGEPGPPGQDRTFTVGTRVTLTSGAPIIIPAGPDVVVVPPVTAAKPLVFETVTLQDGTTNTDGASVVLHFEGGAQHLQFPGGTRHSGEPPAGVPVWATAILWGGTWWLVWPPAPTASAGGAGAAPVQLSTDSDGWLVAGSATQVGSMGRPAPAAGMTTRPLLIRTGDDVTDWSWLAGDLSWSAQYTNPALNAGVRLSVFQTSPHRVEFSVQVFSITRGTPAPGAVRLFVPSTVAWEADVLLSPIRVALNLGSDTKVTRADGVEGWATTMRTGKMYTTELQGAPLYLLDIGLVRGALLWPASGGISVEAAA